MLFILKNLKTIKEYIQKNDQTKKTAKPAYWVNLAAGVIMMASPA